QIAEKQPIRPHLMERCVKPPNFRYHVNFARVAVPSLDAKHDVVHHLSQAAAAGKFVWRIQTEEMPEVAALHFRAAELIEDHVACHKAQIVAAALIRGDLIQSAGLVSPKFWPFGILGG